MSDPRAANKQQEIMDLYKKHGVNPMGGCIPLLIQMPFLYAFYKVLARFHRNAARHLALGGRSFAARTFRHPRSAAHHDCDRLSAAENDPHAAPAAIPASRK